MKNKFSLNSDTNKSKLKVVSQKGYNRHFLLKSLRRNLPFDNN